MPAGDELLERLAQLAEAVDVVDHGSRPVASMAATICSCASRDATEMPCTRTRLSTTGVSGTVASLPPIQPSTAIMPCMRTASSDCASVVAPIVSTTSSTPEPPLASRTREPHCGCFV